MRKILFALLFMLGASFAAFPSCLTQHSVLGSNFAIYDNATRYNCGINLSTPNGWMSYDNLVAGTAGIRQYNSTYEEMWFNTGQAASHYISLSNISLPSSGNFTLDETGATAYFYCLPNDTYDILEASNLIYLTDYNSTDYKFSADATSRNNTFCPKANQIHIVLFVNNGAGSASLRMPYNWSTSTFSGFAIGPNANPDSNSFVYISPTVYTSFNTMNGQGIYSDFMTNKTTAIGSGNISSVCKAILTFSGFTSSYQVTPKITYIPGVDAFADYYNTTNQVAYYKNNTVQYVMGQDDQWYIIPPNAYCDYTIPQTLSVLAVNGTSFNLGGGNTTINNGLTYTAMVQVYQYPSTPVQNAAIFAYNASNTLVGGCLTGSEGQCFLPIANANNGTFTFNFTVGSTPYSFGPQAFSCSGSQCIAQLVIGGYVPPTDLVGKVTGGCLYNSITFNLTCTAADSSSTLNSFQLLLYPYLTSNWSGTSPNCTQAASGSSASLYCLVPNNNVSYIYIFTGYYSNGNPYPLGQGTISRPQTLALDFGSNGWFAMLLLFGTVALVGYYSIPLSIILGCASLFVGMMIGVISWEAAGGASVALLIVGVFLAYRLRV